MAFLKDKKGTDASQITTFKGRIQDGTCFLCVTCYLYLLKWPITKFSKCDIGKPQDYILLFTYLIEKTIFAEPVI